MDRMCGVGLVSSLVRELHHAAKLIALAARRDVEAYGRFEDAGDLGLERSDLGEDALLLGFGDTGPPTKEEHVDEHVTSVIRRP